MEQLSLFFFYLHPSLAHPSPRASPPSPWSPLHSHHAVHPLTRPSPNSGADHLPCPQAALPHLLLPPLSLPSSAHPRPPTTPLLRPLPPTPPETHMPGPTSTHFTTADHHPSDLRRRPPQPPLSHRNPVAAGTSSPLSLRPAAAPAAVDPDLSPSSRSSPLCASPLRRTTAGAPSSPGRNHHIPTPSTTKSTTTLLTNLLCRPCTLDPPSSAIPDDLPGASCAPARDHRPALPSSSPMSTAPPATNHPLTVETTHHSAPSKHDSGNHLLESWSS